MQGSQHIDANVKLAKPRDKCVSGAVAVLVGPWDEATQGHASVNAYMLI